MDIISNFKITWDKAGTPIVFVPLGSKVTGEYSMRMQNGTQTSKRMRARGVKNFARGGISVALSFGVFRDFASDDAARDGIHDQAILMQDLAFLTKTLTVENKSGTSYVLSEAVWKDSSHMKIPFGGEGKSRVRFDYNFDGATWTKLT